MSVIQKIKIQSKKKWILFLVLFFVFYSLSLPFYIDLFFGLGLFWFFLRVKFSEMILVLVSFLFALGVVEVFLRMTLQEKDFFYRPHDKYILPTSQYQPHIDSQEIFYRGDMLSSDPTLPRSLSEKRKIHFKTDSLGKRNNQDYSNEKYILMGDSFVVGQANDQSHILTNVLRKKCGPHFYSLAFSVNPFDYWPMIEEFQKKTGKRNGVILFLFEGNDFEGSERYIYPNSYDVVKSWVMRTTRLSSVLSYPRFTFNVSRRVERSLFGESQDQKVDLHQIAGQQVAFLGTYVERTLADQLEFSSKKDVFEKYPDVFKSIQMIFFIPTKYRVYAELIGHPTPRTPAAGLVSIQEFFKSLSVPIYDLTEALKKRASKLSRRGEYVFWRDDSHWNHHGIEVASEVLIERLGLSCQR